MNTLPPFPFDMLLEQISKYGLLPKKTRLTYKRFKRAENGRKILVDEGYVGENTVTSDFMDYIIASILNKQYKVVKYNQSGGPNSSSATVADINVYSDSTVKILDNFIYGPVFIIFGSTSNTSSVQNINSTIELLNYSSASNNFGVIQYKLTTQTYKDSNGNDVPVYFDLVKKQTGATTGAIIAKNGIKRVSNITINNTTITFTFSIEFEEANAQDANQNMYIEAFGVTAVRANSDFTDIAYREQNGRYSLQIGYTAQDGATKLDYEQTDLILTNYIIPENNTRYPKNSDTAYVFTYEIIF